MGASLCTRCEVERTALEAGSKRFELKAGSGLRRASTAKLGVTAKARQKTEKLGDAAKARRENYISRALCTILPTRPYWTASSGSIQ
jgi:hypothetical protein